MNEDAIIAIKCDFHCDIYTYHQIKWYLDNPDSEVLDHQIYDWEALLENDSYGWHKFKYDPDTGEKIDWEQIKKDINTLLSSKRKHLRSWGADETEEVLGDFLKPIEVRGDTFIEQINNMILDMVFENKD